MGYIKMSTRTFEVCSVFDAEGKSIADIKSGSYHSKEASGAARKAFTRISREINPEKELTLHVHVKDKASQKVYAYEVSRLYDPVEVERNGVKVTYKYKTKVKALKETSS